MNRLFKYLLLLILMPSLSHAMENSGDAALAELLIDSPEIEEKRLAIPIPWVIEQGDLKKLTVTRTKKNRRKQKLDKSTIDRAIISQLIKAEEEDNSIAVLKLMNAIQARRNGETRELLKTFSNETATQVSAVLEKISTDNDRLQAQLAKKNFKNQVMIACVAGGIGLVTALTTALITTYGGPDNSDKTSC